MIPALYEIGYIVSYPEEDVSLQRTQIPFNQGVEDKYHVVKDGDTVESIAQEYYDDQLLWYLIVEANPDYSFDLFELTPNITLLIPSTEVLELLNG